MQSRATITGTGLSMMLVKDLKMYIPYLKTLKNNLWDFYQKRR